MYTFVNLEYTVEKYFFLVHKTIRNLKYSHLIAFIPTTIVNSLPASTNSNSYFAQF